MLTFSRGRRGEARSLSLTPLVKESIKLLAATLPPTVAIRTELDAELPPVVLDPIQIEQVLMNLCINARDAMAGDGQITVVLTCARWLNSVCTACQQPVQGDYVELRVRDTGPGIAPAILERMFEPFFSTKPKGKGSGMGLSTVHGIVHDHGGHILVDTEPGAGAAFRILLRPETTDGARAEPPAEDGEPQTESGHKLRGHVLLIDDDEAVGELMRDLLESWGLRVTALASSLEAQALFVRDPRRFDLILTDQLMPGVTGLVLAKRFLNIRPELPIVLYTGFSDGDTEQQARAHGIRALLRKPVDFDVLFSIVEEALRGRG
jgi:CheY-like chemotaxis protein